MKKLFTSLILAALLAVPVMAQGDSVVSLIFTEWLGVHPTHGRMYYELTNMGDTALDLSNFRTSFIPGWNNKWVDWSPEAPKPPIILSNAPDKWGARLAGTLEPGESVLVYNAFDSPGGDEDPTSDDLRRWSWNKPEFTQHKNNFPVHYPEPGDHEFWNDPANEMWGRDSVDVYNWMCWAFNGAGATVLYYIYPNGDSVVVDAVNLEKAAGSNALYGATDVAGVTEATSEYILVRKANITKGNWDWSQARGVDLSDSEWIPIPAYSVETYGGGRARPFTTVGTHGDFGIDLSSETIAIDDVNNVLTVPWGILKHDSILNEFTIGPGMGWIYTEDSLSVADSAYSTVQTGDILRFMACGNDYEEKDYTIEVADAADDIALVFPKRRMRFEAMMEEDFDGQLWGGEPYYVTQRDPDIDTIGNIPFATRIDTLFKYLEKAPEASWEIDFIDGLERVDVKEGDKLVVTAENGSTQKEYYLSVKGYKKNDNAQLGAITWPDKPFFLEGWKGDTIPFFSPTSTAYQITLPFGTERVPALTAMREDFNATVTTHRATNLAGGQEERTTTFVVTAEDGTTVLEYSILFSVEKPPEFLQLYKAKPFISEIYAGKRDYYEFVNVGDVPLDMSRYMFVHTSSGANPADAITSINSVTDVWNFTVRYGQGYVPGFKFSDDTLTWQANPAKLYFDPAVDPIVDPGDVFVLGNPKKSTDLIYNLIDQSDVITSFGSAWVTQLDTNFNTWGMINLNDQVQMHMNWQALYLFEINNDTILDGDKPVNADPADYTLIDMVGDPATEDWLSYTIGNHQKVDWNNELSYRRQPWIYQGNPEADSASNREEWISNSFNDDGWNKDKLSAFIGSHTFDPVTVHKSTVSSTVYIVSDGYESPQSILGDLTGVTVEALLDPAVLIPADTGQSLSIMGKDAADEVVSGDTLVVVSADGQNTTKYSITSQPLDDNARITLVNDPSNLSIEVDGETGVIMGVEYGALVKDYIDSLDVPALATWAIIDGMGNLIPLQELNYDTVMVETRISDDVFIEVVAQNGTTKILYQFQPAVLSTDAFVISSIYEVDQEENTISGIAEGTGTGLFWDNIDVVRGATATLVDKAGFQREIGTMSFDDKLEVVSEDGTVTRVYYLNFLGEMNPDGNAAPLVTLGFAETTVNGTSDWEVTVSASVEDDGLPFGSEITYKWELIEGDAGAVTIEDDAALETKVMFSGIGTYKLQLTVNDGEKSTTEVVTVTVAWPVGMEDMGVASVRLYPNPATKVLTIELNNFAGSECLLTIFDITGKPVRMEQLFNSSTVLDLELKTGLYVVKVEGSEGIFTKQLRILE